MESKNEQIISIITQLNSKITHLNKLAELYDKLLSALKQKDFYENNLQSASQYETIIIRDIDSLNHTIEITDAEFEKLSKFRQILRKQKYLQQREKYVEMRAKNHDRLQDFNNDIKIFKNEIDRLNKAYPNLNTEILEKVRTAYIALKEQCSKIAKEELFPLSGVDCSNWFNENNIASLLTLKLDRFINTLPSESEINSEINLDELEA